MSLRDEKVAIVLLPPSSFSNVFTLYMKLFMVVVIGFRK
jgi:hypothetical protein